MAILNQNFIKCASNKVLLNMKIRLASKNDRGQWNIYIDKHPEVPPFAKYEWRDVLEHAYRVPTYFFIAEDEQGKIQGICATYATKPWGGKAALYSTRFGLIVDNEQVGQEFLLYLRKFCKEHDWRAYLITSGCKNFMTDTLLRIKKTVFMEIGGSEEEMWKGLRNKTRNMIRKAWRAGIVVEQGFDNLEKFYNIYKECMLEKGVLIHSQYFFKVMAKELGGQVVLFSAKNKKENVGGLLLMYGQCCAAYPYQVSLKEGERFASNQLLIWEAMRFCRAQGITCLDMGESSVGGSVFNSKINFGGMPRDVYYYAKQSQPVLLARFLTLIFPFLPLVLKIRVGIWMKKRSRIL